MTLKRGWTQSTLGDCSEAIQYGLTAKSSLSGSGYRLVRITDIQEGQIAWVTVPFAEESLLKCERNRLLPGDILFARTGATVGKSLLVQFVPESATFASYLIRVRCNQERVELRFAGWFMRSPQYWVQILDGAEGTGQPNFNGSKLAALKIPLPPLAEQRRIAAKLDALTVRIARARAELVRIPKLVQRMKQHALAICFSSAPDRAPILLGTILKNVQAGKNLRCEERPPHLGELGVVKVSAVTWGRFDPTKAKTLPPNYIPPEAARIRVGDLLMSRANTIELVGAVALVERAPSDLFLSDKVLRLVVPEDAKRWIQWFLRSPSGREQIERMATGNQLSMRNLSQDALRRIELPFPNAATRLSAVHELEAAFARADSLQSEAARATKLLDRLEASILAKAFRGELVPQDLADEPVAALLDRIRAERAAAHKPKRGRRAAASGP